MGALLHRCIASWMWFEQDVYKRGILYNFLKIRMPSSVFLFTCTFVYRCPLAGMHCLYYFNASMLKFASVQLPYCISYVISCTKILDVYVYL